MADHDNRPLSPHITIYRPQMNSFSSILIRITGVGMVVGAVMIVAWLLAAATGAECFDHIDGLISSWFGSLILIGSLWALWYHFCGGVRHLIWDMGYGFDLKFVNVSSWIIIVASVVLTLLTLICIA